MKKKILLYDQITLQSLLLQSILIDEGYTCNITNIAKEAFSLLQTHHYDLILLDMTTANGNGIDLLRKIKEEVKENSIPLIALSPKENTKNKKEIMQAGATSCLTKPFLIQDLLNRVNDNLKEEKSKAL